MTKSIIQSEIWKDIKDYEGLYQISNIGRVKSLTHEIRHRYPNCMRVITEKILAPTDNGNGYKLVGLYNGVKRKNFYIHRLVATAFISNPHNENYVNHIDFNKENNKFSNLEWCSQKENVSFSRLHMCKPKNVVKSKTNEKYVYFRNNRFRVAIPNVCDKTYSTIDEAICVRDSILLGRKEDK